MSPVPRRRCVEFPRLISAACQPVEEDELMEDEVGSDLGTGEDGSVEDDEEVDQLEEYGSEEDQLEDEPQEEGRDRRMESEFESEDD